LVLAATDSAGPVLVHLEHDRGPDGAWRPKVWRLAGPPAYADLASDGHSRLAVVYVAAVLEPQPRANALFYLQSITSGASWSTARIITDETPAYEPQVLFARSGSVHVIWKQAAEGSFADGRLWHTTVAARGGVWSKQTSIPLPGVTNKLAAAVDRCGVVHVVMERYDDRNTETIYTRFAAGRWSPLRRPFAPTRISLPELTFDGRQTIHFVGNLALLNHADGTVAESAVMHAVLRLR
jgi:hypothetical protein